MLYASMRPCQLLGQLIAHSRLTAFGEQCQGQVSSEQDGVGRAAMDGLRGFEHCSFIWY
jgi:hypothetical protein